MNKSSMQRRAEMVLERYLGTTEEFCDEIRKATVRDEDDLLILVSDIYDISCREATMTRDPLVEEFNIYVPHGVLEDAPLNKGEVEEVLEGVEYPAHMPMPTINIFPREERR